MPGNSGQESLEFDRKLGPEFIAHVPVASGIYLFKDSEGQIIYVGKAKNLRRRLSQYRLASREKPYRKMRLIVRKAASLEYQVCADEKEALLLENRMILDHKPTLNVAGAFSFMYPYLGIRLDPGRLLSLCYTTTPDLLILHDFELFGAYRSRLRVSEAFEALAFILPFLGHHTPAERKKFGDIPFSRILCFRQLPDGLDSQFRSLLRGESQQLIGQLLLELLEKPSARQLRAEVQSHLENLQTFYATEAQKLRKVLAKHQIDDSMIPQTLRDQLFLSYV